jgi:hypothetical protein
MNLVKAYAVWIGKERSSRNHGMREQCIGQRQSIAETPSVCCPRPNTRRDTRSEELVRPKATVVEVELKPILAWLFLCELDPPVAWSLSAELDQ